jgi:hypothetical protein
MRRKALTLRTRDGAPAEWLWWAGYAARCGGAAKPRTRHLAVVRDDVRPCPACGAPTREGVEVARFPQPGTADWVAYGWAACLADARCVAHELRLKALGALAQW